MRRLLLASAGAVLTALLGLLASVGLWIGVPLGWFWVAGQVDGATESLGAAVAVALIGLVVSVIVYVPMLGWLQRKRLELRAARGLPAEPGVALEAIVVVSAAVAVLLFLAWFFLLSGANPIPLAVLLSR